MRVSWVVEEAVVEVLWRVPKASCSSQHRLLVSGMAVARGRTHARTHLRACMREECSQTIAVS